MRVEDRERCRSVLGAVEDFQNSLDDEEDTRSSQEYMNDLEEEYQARALLAKSKMFFKKEEVSSDGNEVTKVKALIALADEERVSVGKESARNVRYPLLSREKLTGAEPIYEPKTIKSILKSRSTFKAKSLKGIIINEPSSAHARGNKSSSAYKTNSAPAGKLKNVKIEDDPLLAIVMKELNKLKLQFRKNKPSYFRNKKSQQNCKTYGSNVHTTYDHNDIEWFKKREALQAKKVESFKASKTKSLNALRSKTPTKK
nr:retrovirus-related Pol polyprotein from transposon TNT 1-94 [Tanacetum cinerariifolium]